MVGGRKVQLKVYVSREVNEDLRKLIAQKYGKYERGLLSMEVEKALRQWISAHAHGTHTANRVNPPPKLKQKFALVENYLANKYKIPVVLEAPKKDLEEAIAFTIGSDPRTVRKYFNLFLKYKLLKPISGEIYEIV